VNWAEEKFVKVFTRDTPTWRSWPWQARALAPLLMRVLEHDGSLSVGRLDLTRAVALTVCLPEDVVAPGLAGMLEDGTLELRADRLWWPKFEEAQESRKSDALNSRNYRARQRRDSFDPRQTPSDAVRRRQTPSDEPGNEDGSFEPRRVAVAKQPTAVAKQPTDALNTSDRMARQRRDSSTPTNQTPSDAVRRRQTPSDAVSLQTRPDQTRPDQTREKIAGEQSPATKPTRVAVAKQPTDPHHAPLVRELCEVFLENVHGAYPFKPRDARAVSELLAIEPVPERIAVVWRQALRSMSFPRVRTLPELVTHFAHFVGQPTGLPDAADTHAARAEAHRHQTGDLK